MAEPEASDRPTMLFVGVSTESSSVQALFPAWMKALGSKMVLQGVNFAIDVGTAEYRSTLSSMKLTGSVVGALVTTHKVRIFEECADLFDAFTDAALTLGEVGVVYKPADNFLAGDSNDFYSTQRVCELLLEDHRWKRGTREALILGAGGAGTALAHTLCTRSDIGCRSLLVVDIDDDRVEALARKLHTWSTHITVQAQKTDGSADGLMSSLGDGSLVVNATGLGKDRPGSPVTPNAVFPQSGIVWEFNYRFTPQPTPNFLEIALSQQAGSELLVEDGWQYFVWGWALAICRVLNRTDPQSIYEQLRLTSPERAVK